MEMTSSSSKTNKRDDEEITGTLLPNQNCSKNSGTGTGTGAGAGYSFEGLRLSCFLRSFHRQIELERHSNRLLHEKLWFKQQFAIGVNEVTRLLKRMSTSHDATFPLPKGEDSVSLLNQGQRSSPCTFPTKLQVVLVASDCNPRWLSKHLLSLASCKNVPLISVKDKNEGSLRLGELVKVKTAIAVGIKAKGSSINRFLQIVLRDDKIVEELEA